MSRTKKQIPAMMPVKKWLSKEEAMAYTDLSVNVFDEAVLNNNLTVSFPTGGKKPFYKVTELDRMFESCIAIKSTSLKMVG